MISDFILSIFAFYFFYQSKPLSKNWSLFFLFMGISAIVGAAFHGGILVGQQFRFISWAILSASLIFAQLATYERFYSKSLNLFFVLKSVIFLSLAITYTQFLYMVIDIAISLLGFVVVGNMFYLKNVSNKISIGILISIVSAVIVVLKVDLHPVYLTANDIGHYISILSLLYISKGVGENSYILEVERA
ncbi:MAG: hypothetical protein KAG84_00520 [Bacteroidales bacterium]|nr:hypothetical protein [Bacteroidales bacterium]